MNAAPLPTVINSLTDFLFLRDGVETRITEGYKNAPPMMQEQYPLEQRLAQERTKVQDRVNMLVMDAIKGEALTVRSYDGVPIRGPYELPRPVPLAVSFDDLQTWLSSWMTEKETRQLMQMLDEPKPKKAGPGRSRLGGPDDETMLAHWQEIEQRYTAQGSLAIAQKVIAAYPSVYEGVTPEALRKRYERKTGQAK
ncbi:hypothetical protein HAP99_10090 [Acidithiobacillus caldus]|uniref:hypothetical protein n=1 Tax=Acidithiobacillus caldus TaxID=33059 RepID=UPI001C06D8EE|nr:hypothetical protein [Acidithiobacillus caldus]MBU2783519.1 hypothetical protein [Acidithiobacillus caldus]